jgi:phage tail sheath protein FI
LEDAETVDVNLLFAYPDANGANTISNDLIAIATARKDCMSFVSPPIDDTVNSASPAANVKAWADTLTSSSYGSADSTALYVYDKYNDKYRWIGSAGHIAGLCAATDRTADAWFSPAGASRGQLFGVTKLAFNPVKADRDTLYKARVNPIVSFPGEGTLLFGDKTLLSKPSAFDRINVRRLFNTIEKAISTAAKAQLFEFNDEFTRAQFKNLVEPFLRDVKGRRGVTDFLVVCDTTNNTGQVIDTNNFVADIFIKPARSINFITLNFIATRTGVSFTEIAGS